MNDWWSDITPLLSPTSKERLGYPTQKPEALLERIIKASSNEGDTVLDAFCGCGTTVAVAQRLGRKWIGIDISYRSISLIKERLVQSYGAEVMDTLTESGMPKDIESARALSLKKDDRLRKEFEKWAVLTYSNNKAMINDKKGADGGIDGNMVFDELINGEHQHRDIVFQVKSGKVGSPDIRDFAHVISRQNAAFGVLITLEPPTKPMIQEAALLGAYSNDSMTSERIKIVTIQQILDGERLSVPLAKEVNKKARAAARQDGQMGFEME